MHVIVIGSGLLGVSTAYFLNQYGHEVTVFDRQHGPGLETSFANGGMITPSQSEPWNSPGILRKLLVWMGDETSPVLLRPKILFSLLGWGTAFIRYSREKYFHENIGKNAKLVNYSLNVLNELCQQHDIDYDSSENGTMKIYKSGESLEQGIAHTKLYEKFGVHCEVLGPDEIIDIEPALSEINKKLAGAIYYPDDESGDAHKFCRLLSEHAANNGVAFRYGEEIKTLQRVHDRIVCLETTKGRYTADSYVLAAGSYSPIIARTINLKLPIQPVKGYSLTIDLNGWKNGPRLPVIDDTRHIGITPLASKLRIVGTAEFNGYNKVIQQSRMNDMFEFAGTTFPRFVPYMDRDLSKQWACLRPYSCDGVPILGKTPLINFYLNTGHGHLGWSMAAGSGRLLAELLSNKQTGLNLSPYQMDRF